MNSCDVITGLPPLLLPFYVNTLFVLFCSLSFKYDDKNENPKLEFPDYFFNQLLLKMGSFALNEIMTNQSPVSGLFGVEPIESEVIEKQPVSLYRHSLADICILVDPSTKEIIPKQSSQVLDYMRTHHAQDSIQDMINDKTLVLVGGNNVSTKANLVSAGKIEEKDSDRDNDNLGKFMRNQMII